MNLETTLAGVKLEHPIMNAAGTCKTVEDVEKFARSAVSAIVVGSATVLPRLGNEGNVFWPGRNYSLNSLGMPNPGMRYYEANLGRMVSVAHAAGKPLIFQAAGFSAQEYGELVGIASEKEVDLIELNLGCPNVWDDGQQKGIASFDPDSIEEAIVEARRNAHQLLGLKLSPYSDPNLLERVAKKINSLYFAVGYAALSNTFPNALHFDLSGRPVISNGLAGLSGRAMKPIALGQVEQFAKHIEDIDLVGAGGIFKGEDVLDYLWAGASAVQAATIYWNANEDPGVYSDLLATYINSVEMSEFAEKTDAAS